MREEVNINLKYEGYIKRQQKQVEQFHKLESKKIPSDIDYEDIKSLRLEAIQKLSDIARNQLDRQRESVVFLHPIFPCLRYT